MDVQTPKESTFPELEKAEKLCYSKNMNHLRRPKTEESATDGRPTERDTPYQDLAPKAVVNPLKYHLGQRQEHFSRLKAQGVPLLAEAEIHKLNVRGMPVPQKDNASRKQEGTNKARAQRNLPHGDPHTCKERSKERLERLHPVQPLALTRPPGRPLQLSIQRTAWDNYSLHTQDEGLQIHRPVLARSWLKYGFHAYSAPFNSTTKPSQKETYFIFDCRAENLFSRMLPSVNHGSLLKPFAMNTKAMLYINGESLKKSRTSAYKDASTQTTANQHPLKLQDAGAENQGNTPAETSDTKNRGNDQGMKSYDSKKLQSIEETSKCLKVDISTGKSKLNLTLPENVPFTNQDLLSVPKSTASAVSYLSVPPLCNVFAEDKDMQRLQTSRMSAEAVGLPNTDDCGCSTFLLVPGGAPHSCSSVAWSTDDTEHDESEITIHVPIITFSYENRE